MMMSQEEFRNECIYSVTMSHIKTMLKRGLITEAEYREINTKMKAKYLPVSDGLVSEKDLLCPVKRA